MKKQKYKEIKVIWKDITFFSEQESIKKLKEYKLLEIETCGYLIKEDKEKIIVALSLLSNNNATDFYLIPKVNIIKITFRENI